MTQADSPAPAPIPLTPLPDLLTCANGQQVTTAEEWRTLRRPEILELFRQNVYGRNPIERPADLKFTVKSESAMEGRATRKLVTLTFSGPHGAGTLPFTLFIPNQATPAAPVPAFLLIAFDDRNYIDPTRQIKHPFWPAEEMVRRGYAACAFFADDIAPNKLHDFSTSVHALFETPGQPRAADAWGTIAAWAWGASRIMDCLETNPQIDAKRIAVVGHSRSGKAALWCGAQDERFALTMSNNSGCTGASLSRKNVTGTPTEGGETVADINQHFPHWFCDHYKKFNNNETALPVDQHMLLALMAPRLVYVGSAEDDAWADPYNEFAACFHAQPAWRLSGIPTLSTRSIPLTDYPLQGGSIGYHIRSGKHDLSAYDWVQYLNYADRQMTGSGE